MLTLVGAALIATLSTAQERQTGPLAQEALEQEIIVTARRLDGWRGQATYRERRPRCRTIVSTGDRRIDRIGCDAMVHCIATTREGATGQGEWQGRMGDCVREQRETRLREHLSGKRG